MPLTREEAQAIINVVSNDQNCRSLIQSVLRIMPAHWKAGGWMRNAANTIIYDVGAGIVSKSAWQEKFKNGFVSGLTESFPQSKKFQAECCNGIAKATTAAICSHLSQLPFVSGANDSQGTITDYGHYATKVIMKKGGEYTFDWWMSLDVYNPILWRTKDWLHYPNSAIMNKGVDFYNFEGFDN